MTFIELLNTVMLIQQSMHNIIVVHNYIVVTYILVYHKQYITTIIQQKYRRVTFCEQNSDAPNAIKFVRGQAPECLAHTI